MTHIDEQYKTTAALLRKARQDPDAVSCFANGESWADTQEAVFVVKGKRKVEQAFGVLVAAGLLTSNPVTANVELNGERSESARTQGYASAVKTEEGK